MSGRVTGPIRVLAVGEGAVPEGFDPPSVRVATEPTAADARRRLEADGGIDCVVSAYELPEGDGTSLFESLRDGHGDVPFVLVAADGAEVAAGEAVEADLTGYLGKDGDDWGERLLEEVTAAVSRHREEARAREAADHLERISDGIVAMDGEWRITYINEEGARLLKRDVDDLLGANVWEEFPEATDLAFYEEYRRAVETGEPTTFEEYYPPLETWFEVHAYPSAGGLSVYFIDITDRKRVERALLSGGDVAIEFDVDAGESDMVLFEFARAAGARLDLEGLVPHADGSGTAYVSIRDVDPGAVRETAAGIDGIDGVRAVSERREERLFEFALPELEFAPLIAEYSATIRSVTAGADGGRIVVVLPPSVDVRAFVETVTDAAPSLEFVARHEVERGATDLYGAFLDDLTDRQREVIEVAYHSGFFEWPRDRTGDEIAGQLGITPPTFHQHVRKAVATLLDAVVGTPGTEAER